MDILHLVDRLEELFNESRPVPLTHTVMVDEERMLDIIDQMRVSIPEEIKKAQQLLAQRDRILAQAQEEATRTITLAREKSEQMIEREGLMEVARQKAEAMTEEARKENERARREADEYVMQSLSSLESELDRILTQVRNGIRTLQSDKQAAAYNDNRTKENA